MLSNSFNIAEIIPFIQKHQYSQAIGQITYLIQSQQQNKAHNYQGLSALFVNRAVLQILQGRLQEAFNDINKSIHTNHLNYASYFNLFALRMMNNLDSEKRQGLKQLCCSISCLYLVRGRLLKAQKDINKAIQYSQNNLEARVAKSLLYLTKGKYKLALNQINWALDLKPNDQRAQKICIRIKKLLDQQKQMSDSRQNIQFEFSGVSQEFYRLQCSFYEENQLDNCDITAQISEKLLIFNQLYAEINGDSVNLLAYQSPALFMLYREVTGNLLTAQSSSSIMLAENQANNEQEPQTKIKNVKQIVRQLSVPVQKNVSCDVGRRSLNFDQLSSVKGDQEVLNSVSQSQYSSRYNTNTPTNFSVDSGFTLHALEGDKSLGLKIYQIQLLGKSPEALKDVYCQFKCGSKSNISLQGSWDQRNWQQQFDASLDDEPQILIIHVFHKQILEFNDKLIALGEKQLCNIGRISIPIYLPPKQYKITDKSLSQYTGKLGETIGNVILDIKFK